MLAGTFLIGGLATLSLPGLAPFISEFLVLVGTFTRYPVIGIIATFGIVLAALYTLVLYQRTMTGPVKPEVSAMPDLRVRELVVVAPLVALLIFLGVFPKPLTDIVNPRWSRPCPTYTEGPPAAGWRRPSEAQQPSTACGQRRQRRPTRSGRSTRRRSSTGSCRPSSSSSARRSSES